MPCTQQEHSVGVWERSQEKAVFWEWRQQNPPDTLVKCVHDDISLSFPQFYYNGGQRRGSLLPWLTRAKLLKLSIKHGAYWSKVIYWILISCCNHLGEKENPIMWHILLSTNSILRAWRFQKGKLYQTTTKEKTGLKSVRNPHYTLKITSRKDWNRTFHFQTIKTDKLQEMFNNPSVHFSILHSKWQRQEKNKKNPKKLLTVKSMHLRSVQLGE